MQYNWFEKASPLTKMLLMLILMACSVFVAFFISILLAMPFTHKSMSELFLSAADIYNLNNIGLLKYLQIVQSVALFIIPPLIVVRLFGAEPKQYLNLVKRPRIISLAIVVVIVLSAIPFINFLEDVNAKMKLPSVLSGLENWMKDSEKNAAFLSEIFLRGNGIGALSFNLLMMAILPAIGEEMVFRGVFQKLFTELCKNKHLGIIFSAALFSALHLQFYGFVPRMMLGVIFGYLLVWSGSLWVPIAAHFVNNTMGVLFYYFHNQGVVGNQLQTAGTEKGDHFLVALSAFAVIALIWLFYNYEEKFKKLKNV